MHILEDFIYTEMLDHDLHTQRKTAHYMQNYINNEFSDGREFNGQVTLSTKLFDKYNYLMYPLPGIHQLYSSIRNVFHKVNDGLYEDYFIQCWLNFYYKGDFIDWHGHWPTEAESWHGLPKHHRQKKLSDAPNPM